jgi:RNA polymerase sigma-70 factor (ECF subfamily)
VAADDAASASDGELLRWARLGDRAAFGRLVERHHRSLAAILRQRAGPAAPLEDLLQEVFARSLEHIGSFRSEASFLTWATSIGLHLAADWRRRDERRRRLAPPADVDGDAVPCRRAECDARAAEDRDEVRRARAALDDLPPDVRAAVTLRIVEDLDYDEIAARLGAPVPRVRQWVCRGLKRLRATLEVCDDEA